MANYNTFAVVNCKRSIVLLITSSARKAMDNLEKGRRVEIWNENIKSDTVYAHKSAGMKPYIQAEREYRKLKQEQATKRNARIYG